MGEVGELVRYLNDSGGIPLTIKTVSETSWAQFSISIGIALLSSIFILMFLWEGHIKPWVTKITIKTKLRKIMNSTRRSIVVIKHTQNELFNSSMIDGNTFRKIMEAMNKLNGKPFDLLLYTPGGEIFYSMYISRMLKNYPGKIRAIIPTYAMSGGTLLALSCDEIWMSENSCLGPVDPQLGTLFKYGSAKSWKYITQFKGKKAEDSTISFSLMGEQYTKSIANHIDYLLSDKILPKKRKEFVSLLTSGDIEHAYHLTPQVLESKGLNIEKIPAEIMQNLQDLLQNKRYEGVYFLEANI